MKEIKTKPGVHELKLSDLVIDKAQVRRVDVGKEIKELADNIRRCGLLHPILVMPRPDGKYEIVAGQRRFLAHKELQRETINAFILDQELDKTDAITLSMAENMLRRDVATKDMIDVCTDLYKRYGSVRMVVEETGLPAGRVNQYVKYDRLDPKLKNMVDSGTVNINTALRAQDAASVDGDLNVTDAIKLAKEMQPMSGAQQDKIVKARVENPDTDVDDVIEEAKSGGKITQVVVTLGQSLHSGLQKYAKTEETDQNDAARMLIEEGLLSKGFIPKEN